MTYLDYAATNPYTKFPCSKYGPFMNPNANYAHKEKQLLHDCEERIKSAIGAKSGKVLFGGTSSQLVENLFFTMNDNECYNPYITIAFIYEHDSIFRFADQWGNIESLRHTIETYHGDKQLIVMLQGVNNITGQIMPIKEIGELCWEHNAFLVCDLTALIGHSTIPDNIDEWCSCCFFSGHKISTELGIGAMWISDEFNIWLGDMTLHGTPNLAGALAICDATEWAVKNIKDNIRHSTDLYCYLKGLLEKNKIPHIDVNSDAKWSEWSPFINAIRLIEIDAMALQQFLASKDIYIGIGQSSCAANEDFRQLCNGYNLKPEEAREVVRISFGEYSTYEDIDRFIDGVKEFKEKYL